MNTARRVLRGLIIVLLVVVPLIVAIRMGAIPSFGASHSGKQRVSSNTSSPSNRGGAVNQKEERWQRFQLLPGKVKGFRTNGRPFSTEYSNPVLIRFVLVNGAVTEWQENGNSAVDSNLVSAVELHVPQGWQPTECAFSMR
jgi:hypothetical protein